MIKTARLICFWLSAATLAAGFWIGGYWVGSILILLLAFLGWFWIRKSDLDIGSGGFVFYVAGAALGINLKLPAEMMLFTLLASLAFWDLDAFYQKLCKVKTDLTTSKLENTHMIRLALAIGIGLAIGLAGLWFTIQLSLGWAILISLVIILGIQLGIGMLRESPGTE